MICVSDGVATIGAISIIAVFESYYKAGFPLVWWDLLNRSVVMIIFLSGWVVYRFRQTRAMTLAQFFEMRYSRRFRIFSGIVAWLSGIINFGIFPSVGTRFLIYFCELPQEFTVFHLTLSTYPVLMFALLTMALLFTFTGGQITILITNFIQGVFCNFGFVILIIFMLFVVKPDMVMETLSEVPQGQSMLNPFDSLQMEDFNLFFYLILMFGVFYGSMAWQGTQAFNASAINAQEAKMGKVLNEWRMIPQNLFLLVLPVCAYTIFHHSDFSQQASLAQQGIDSIADPQLRIQMFSPIILSTVMRKGIGVMGVFCAIIIAAELSTNTSYLHSWGSIFIQDVIMPFRKKPFDKKTHMFLLRVSILFVAVFIYFFSLLFKQTDYILMFMQITGAIYIGGAGAAIIGGLYWKQGTTIGAWAAMLTGSIGSGVSICIQQMHHASAFSTPVLAYIGSRNGAVLGFYVALLSIAMYVLFSLLTYSSKKTANLEKLLHRGQYAVKEIERLSDDEAEGGWLVKLFGLSNNMKLKDKILSLITCIWSMFFVLLFIAGTVINVFIPISLKSWAVFWKLYIYLMTLVSIAVALWLLVGAVADYKKMIRYLEMEKIDDTDDGFVKHNQKES